MTRVLAQATVDRSDLGWRVTVTGQPPHAQQRAYSIAAATDDAAAQEGIRRFVEEKERAP